MFLIFGVVLGFMVGSLFWRVHPLLGIVAGIVIFVGGIYLETKVSDEE